MGKITQIARAAACALACIASSGLALSGGARAQDGEAFMRLPDTEIPGQQAAWYVNATLDAMTDAVEKGRPLVMVFGDKTSPRTIAFAQYVAPCPHINQIAGQATFAYGSPLVDEFARRMAVHFNLTDYPTISVIAPRTDRLVELYRMEGSFTGAEVGRDLYLALAQSNHWHGAPPEPLPTHYLAYPNLGCTREGFERLGLGQ